MLEGALPRLLPEGDFSNEATEFFLLNRIVSIRLRAVTRGPLTSRQSHHIRADAAVGFKPHAAQFALDPSEGGIVADTL